MLKVIFRLVLLVLVVSLAEGQGHDGQLSGIGKEFNASIILPGSPQYAAVTQPFNLRFNFKPAAVAFPTNAQEISAIVKLANRVNHQVVARSGGHSYIANGLGGKNGVIVVDLRNFQKVKVDDRAGTAVIEMGTRLGDIVTSLAGHGRALPHGTCAYVGIGGHATYGGYGFTSRLWGLTIDTVLSFAVVLANGTITTASSKANPDLFWAMRGAGGSFGIATAITVKTFAAPLTATIFSYNWQFTAAGAAAALGAFQTFGLTANLPGEIAAEIVITRGNVQGNITIGLAGGWYRPISQLNATLKPFLDHMPPPRTITFDTGDYLHSATNLAGGSLDTSAPPGTDTFYAKSLMTPQSVPMTQKALLALMNVIANDGFTTPVGWWFFQVELFGGKNSAINAVKKEDTSFGYRDTLFTIQFYASSPGNRPPYPRSGFTFLDNVVNSVVNAMPKDWPYGAYVNYVDDRLDDWQKRYYGANYARLRRLKAIYDPRGLFSFPTSI
ncbi:unnamed protein product [Cyclocybe aegerita]|uniref:FAD-binding PCMH-type domain-containing protein n=1 Tax=Cyclocybe aegerita TaxID=1973307 RepID=A0A8S0WAW5_CYCAE|nr:unnamed protein product [Cyclocybe aegerita]